LPTAISRNNKNNGASLKPFKNKTMEKIIMENYYRDPDLTNEDLSEEDVSPLSGTAKTLQDYLTSKLSPLIAKDKEKGDYTPVNLTEVNDAPLRLMQTIGSVADVPASYARRGIYNVLGGEDKDEVSGGDIIGQVEKNVGAPVPEMPGATLKMKDALGLGTEIIADPLILGAGAYTKAGKEAIELAKRAPSEFAKRYPTIAERLADTSGAIGARTVKLKDLTQPLPGFYSKAEKTVMERMGGSASPEQIYSIKDVLDKKGNPTTQRSGFLASAGIKPEEIEFLKIPEFLKGKEKVTREELLDHIRKNLPNLEIADFGNKYNSMGTTRIPGEYAFKGVQYHPKPLSEQEAAPFLKGGEEIDKELQNLLTLKDTLKLDQIRNNPEITKIILDHLNKKKIELAQKRTENLPKHLYAVYDDELEKIDLIKNLFTDYAHYGDKPNILGHYRRKIVPNSSIIERTSNDGDTYFLDELQSQYHHRGTTEGYRTEEQQKILEQHRQAYERFKELRGNADELERQLAKLLDDNGFSFNEYTKIADKYKNPETGRVDFNNKDYKNETDEWNRKKEKFVNNSPEYKELKEKIHALTGYDSPAKEYLRKVVYPIEDQLKEVAKKSGFESVSEMERAMPDAPFKGDAIYELLFKLALQEAAEKGATTIAVPTSKTVIDRFPSRSQVPGLGKITIVPENSASTDIKPIKIYGYKSDPIEQVDHIQFPLLRERKAITTKNLGDYLNEEQTKIAKAVLGAHSFKPVPRGKFSVKQRPIIEEADFIGPPNEPVPTELKFIGDQMQLGGGRFRKIYDKVIGNQLKKLSKEAKKDVVLRTNTETGSSANLKRPDRTLELTDELIKKLKEEGQPLWLIPFLMQQMEEEMPEEKKDFNKINNLVKDKK
jgi:hypothetical protein